MQDINSLLAAAQAAGVGGPTATPAPMPQGGSGDPQAQLMQLLSGVASSPQGGQMLQAVTQMMGGMGNNGGAQGQIPNYTGPGASDQRVRATGYEDSDLDTPQGTAPNDSAADRMPGQKNMGGYLNAKSGDKPISTEDELADVQKRMGGDPSDDGNFPTRAEIKALNNGDMTPQEFDRKWGKGAAAEMMDEAEPDKDDEGDHEYR